jgi:hypothetical protein
LPKVTLDLCIFSTASWTMSMNSLSQIPTCQWQQGTSSCVHLEHCTLPIDHCTCQSEKMNLCSNMDDTLLWSPQCMPLKPWRIWRKLFHCPLFCLPHCGILQLNGVLLFQIYFEFFCSAFRGLG